MHAETARAGPPGAALWRDAWIVAALAAALALRLINLDAAPLWYDEVYTAEWLKLPWWSLIAQTTADKHPPLYFLLLKAWSGVAGDSALALRLPSVAAAMVAVAAIAAVADRLFGRGAARWAAWAAALSPFLIQHGQEARMYAFASALAALQWLLVTRYATGAAPRLGAGFVLVTLALVGTHYHTVWPLAGFALALLWLRALDWRAWLPGLASAALLAGLAVTTAALLATRQPAAEYATGILALPGAVWALVGGYALLPTSAELHAGGIRAALPLLPIAFAALVPCLIVAAAAPAALGREGRLLVLGPLLAAGLAPFAVHLALGVGVHPRYLAAALPPLLVVFAAVAAAPTCMLRRSAVAALLAVMAIGTARHLAMPGHGREDVGAARRWLDAHVPGDAEILVSSFEMADLARFHWPERRIRVYPPRRVVVRQRDAARWADGLTFDADARAYYVIGREWVSDPDDALRAELLRRYPSCGRAEVRGIHLLCLERRGDGARQVSFRSRPRSADMAGRAVPP